ncbi:hypothetical protein VP01_2526g2 [Puccinia sorghi]|uniref:Uncharacterized protein n=1 Tax=Puccinia sorghi TaxID=27349 RepID=A0A0L6V5K3_9BASI|nr:hypothetical protein VP01_2526g2 [Puccinia sorghi]
MFSSEHFRKSFNLSVESSSQPEGQKAERERKQENVDIADLIKVQKELLTIYQEKQRSFESFSNDMIMGKDLTGLDEESGA